MILRSLARAAAIIAAATTLGTAAQACDQRFPWTCKPVPSTATEEAVEPKAGSKPLQITSRRAARAKASSRSAGEQSTSTRRARLARKASARRAERSRHARPVAAARAADRAEKAAVVAPKVASEQPTERQAVRAPRLAAGRSDPNSAFAMMWKDRTTVTAEPAELSGPAPAGEPAAQPASTKPAAVGAPDPVPTKPVQVVAKDEANEIDLAAANPEVADSSWLRNLFLALGGLLAVGSAVRFLV